jgi:D-Tyr-tRNAtyr deacylase
MAVLTSISMISQFTLAADFDESLRVASVELKPPSSGYAVITSSQAKTSPVVRFWCQRPRHVLTSRL